MAVSGALTDAACSASTAELRAAWAGDLPGRADRTERLQPGLLVVARATVTVAEPCDRHNVATSAWRRVSVPTQAIHRMHMDVRLLVGSGTSSNPEAAVRREYKQTLFSMSAAGSRHLLVLEVEAQEQSLQVRGGGRQRSSHSQGWLHGHAVRHAQHPARRELMKLVSI